jgi:hypothetical protein
MRPRITTVAVIGLLAVVALGACNDDEPSVSEATIRATASTTASTVPDRTEPPAPGTVPDTGQVGGQDGGQSGEPTTTIAVVPDTGVPGIDSSDPFCRSWSEFAGSFQVLATVGALGGDAERAALVEVVAAPAVVAAVDTMSDGFPDELAAERQTFVIGLLGPITNRAQAAVAELRTAGLSGQQLESLGRRWLETIAEVGLADPDVVPDVPVDIAPLVAAAVAQFATVQPPFATDPSLVTDVQAPATQAYIAVNCPDQGTLGGNDIIDD